MTIISVKNNGSFPFSASYIAIYGTPIGSLGSSTEVEGNGSWTVSPGEDKVIFNRQIFKMSNFWLNVSAPPRADFVPGGNTRRLILFGPEYCTVFDGSFVCSYRNQFPYPVYPQLGDPLLLQDFRIKGSLAAKLQGGESFVFFETPLGRIGDPGTNAWRFTVSDVDWDRNLNIYSYESISEELIENMPESPIDVFPTAEY